MQGHPVTGAVVKVIGNNQNFSTQTDAAGNFSLLLPPGIYTVRAEAAKYDPAVYAPVSVANNELKNIEITLPEQATKQQPALAAPEFFDQPHFTIAGVTDTTNLGGHASGMTGPSESLAKDVIALAPKPTPASPNAAREKTARQLADQNPDDFHANYSAGKLLLDDGNPREALSYLTRAADLNREDYENSYALAQAYTQASEYADARTLIRKMLAEKQSAELHHLLATVEERSGNPLQAEAEYEQSAKLDPSEDNLFDWGMELLRHRALEPAIEVFRRGNRRFPQSARMLGGLAAAFYERGSFDEALQYACAATDVTPSDTGPYLLLGKMQNADRGQSDVPLTRLDRLAQLQPENAWANYYYALALWKRRKGPEDISTAVHVESLLQKAVKLDAKLAKAYFQLGVVYSETNKLPQAITAYESAVRVDPQLAEAHYRLAQAYVAAGQKEKSQQEIALYKQNSKARADATERERRELQQFVYTMQPVSETNQ